MKRPSITLNISPVACLLFAAMLLLVPLPWLLAWITAMAVHELGHIAAVALSGRQVEGLWIGASGIKMKVEALPLPVEVFCAAAGPAAGCLLLLLARWLPRTALCAAAQSLYNLLPVYPMDGGRIFYALVHTIFPLHSDSILRWTRIVVMGILLLLALYGFFALELGLIPLIFFAVLLFRTQKIKSSCKPARLRVQ